jgi:hypothetical protein
MRACGNAPEDEVVEHQIAVVLPRAGMPAEQSTSMILAALAKGSTPKTTGYKRSSGAKRRNCACGGGSHSSSSGASAPRKAETTRRHQLASGSLV